MNKQQIKLKLSEIKLKGYIVSLRKGNTGIGYTLETMLGIKENNLKMPDFGKIELKAKRKGVSTPITMFTFNRAVWVEKQIDVIKKYGYLDTNGRQSLYCFVCSKPNPQGLFLETKPKSLKMKHIDGSLLAEWQASDLIDTFNKKMPALILVQADTRINSDQKEEFHFNKASLMSKPMDSNLLNMISKDEIIVDVRMHINLRGSVRNHGTGFRSNEEKIKNCFSKIEELI